MAGVEVHGAQRVVLHAAGHHEGQRAVDLGGELFVLGLHLGVADELRVPGVDAAQVGEAALDEGAYQVQRGGRGVVDLQEALRVVRAGGLGELEAVDRVAAVGREADVAAGLHAGRPGLRVLAGDAADLHDGHLRGVGHHDGHRQLDEQLALDVLRGHRVEGLGAVAALEQEGAAVGHVGHLQAQVVALPREHQRRKLLEGVDGAVERCQIGIRGLLDVGQRA